MFEERLRVLLIVFGAGLLVVLLRLFQLQVVQADHYQRQAEQRLVKRARTLKPIRGRILDRNHRVLASDEPAWSIAVHYRLLTEEADYHKQLAEEFLGDRELLLRHARFMLQIAQAGDFDRELLDDLVLYLKQNIDASWVENEIDSFWKFLAARSDDLEDRRTGIVAQVHRWKRSYVRSHSLSPAQAKREPIAEELHCHPLLDGLKHNERIALEREIRRRYVWLMELGAVEVVDSSTRAYHDSECLAHVVGHLRQVKPQDITDRPYRWEGLEHDRGGYRPRDVIGESGVERMAEERLRGTRGRLTTYRDERPPLRIPALLGEDVTLTIDWQLQSAIYQMLAERVRDAELADVPGGSVVVLDVPTRQVLALVSYPAYDPNEYRSEYATLSRDFETFPLHFRAVFRQYEPGSIVKPMTVVAAHMNGLIDPQTLFECRGRLDPNIKGFRCWLVAGSNASVQHGLINSEQAIMHSCNVFCYQLGDLFRQRENSAEMGVQRMWEWMNLFGLGRLTGIGLPEEKKGIAPSPSYLRTKKHRSSQVSDLRNYAIGQGEMQVTPLQAANLVATYASGVSQPVSLLIDQPDRAGVRLPGEESLWRLIRRGMYQVVNVSGGTATQFAKLDHPGFVLCGKSGSAQTNRWITECRIDYRDGDGERSLIIPANSKAAARSEFVRREIERLNIAPKEEARWSANLRERIIEVTPTKYWPLGAGPDRKHSHAWFVAFLQPKDAAGMPDWDAPSPIAIAVLLEFGGSGGRNSGPLCRDVAQRIISDFSQYVDGSAALARGGL